ncbi:MAG TPA: terminase family protein [Terriglobia bacterium]|nr:terminase family protein [Terriglobia bacterium]
MPRPEKASPLPAAASARAGALGRAPLPPVLALLPYQRRWIEDDSPLKIVVKARQIGYSFAATLRVVLECLKRKTTWILLSKGERQSKLMMEKVQEHIQSCGIVARACECEYFEGARFKQLETRFPNGSVIYGLPANADTARGYSGNVTLDEFAFHADAEKIYSALYPSTTRGYRLEVISTPNGQQGKFYELAKTAGLDGSGSGVRGSGFAENRMGLLPSRKPNPENRIPAWSAHYCDIYEAVRQGLKINLQQLRAGCEDDAAWRQEFGCQFVSTAENFFPPELLASCLSAEATIDVGPGQAPASWPAEGLAAPRSAGQAPPLREYFLGIDIGRRHDRTVFWVDEIQVRGARYEVLVEEPRTSHLTPGTSSSIVNRQSAIGNLSVTRLVRGLSNVPFDTQLAYARELLSLREGNGAALIRRAAIDATGMGAPLAESLAQEFGPRIEPVVFTAAVKEDLAYRTKRRMESGLTLLPDSREIRRAFSAVKKFVTVSGNVRFDAARTDAGHSDEFWAKALADLAAATRPTAHLTDGYLASGHPLISPNAFLHTDANWAARLNQMVF